MTAVKWATVADVLAVTKKVVTQEDIDAAVFTIELGTGAIQDVERPYLSRRDYYWLRLAVCYQAAWLTTQPDHIERSALESVNQDGVNISAPNTDWLKYGPLTIAAIKRLSWKGTRTLAPRSPLEARPIFANFLSYDTEGGWTPL